MQASATLDINRPIEDVFAYVSDPSNMEAWVVGVSDVRIDGDPTEVGTRFESSYTYGGRTVEMTYEILACDPPTRYAMRGSGPFPFEGELTLTEVAGVTRVRNTVDAGSDGFITSVMFSILGPVLRRTMAKQLREELAALRSALEATPGTEMAA